VELRRFLYGLRFRTWMTNPMPHAVALGGLPIVVPSIISRFAGMPIARLTTMMIVITMALMTPDA
jgi:hypothetical protein